MFKLEVIKLFAEENNMDFATANAVATPWELFDTYLRYEGIIGYTDAIITTFRECFLQDMYEYRVWYSYNDPVNEECDHVKIIANSCQEAADKVRGNRQHLPNLQIRRIVKKCGNSWIAVNAWH